MSSWIFGDNEIHFWYCDLNQILDEFQEKLAWLSPEERITADHFYFQKDKVRFVLSRGFLRELIGRYLNQDPVEILFVKNSFGKPKISFASPPKEEGCPDIFFNLSHSESSCLVGISKSFEIGVDLEVIQENRSYEKIAEKYFSFEEKKYFLNSPSEKSRRFYQLWTCKEAFLKGIGEGLHFPLREVCLQIQESPLSISLKLHSSLRKFSSWSVQLLNSPLKHTVAACAVSSPIQNLKYSEKVWKKDS